MTFTPPPQDGAYKLAALQALAEGGTRAKAAVDQAKQAMDLSRQYAMQAAMNNSQQLGVGQAGQDELAALVNRPTQSSQKVIDRTGTADQAYLGALKEPLGRVFDTKYAAQADTINKENEKALLKLQKGSGGGGSGRKAKDPTAAWKDEYGTQANMTFALKQAYPETKYGDYRAAQKAAVEKGLDPLTAQRLYNTGKATEIIGFLQEGIARGATPQAVRAKLNQEFGNNPGEVTYWINQYQQMAGKPSGLFTKAASKAKKK